MSLEQALVGYTSLAKGSEGVRELGTGEWGLYKRRYKQAQSIVSAVGTKLAGW